MRSSRRAFLKGVGAIAGASALGGLRALAASNTTVTVWASPFVYGIGPDAKLMDPFIQANIAKALPTIQLSTDYGPGPYAQMESKYLVQARTGTPDVIEGLLENVVAYVRAGDILPVTDRFNAWADKGQFVQSALNGLMYNGQLLGVPYNTNARGMLYRKSILKKLGLKVPTTWDELVNVTVAQITKVYELYYNLYFGSKTNPAVGNPAGAAGISSYVQDPGYVSGLWAMVPMGPWIIARQTQSSLAKQILLHDTGVTSMPVAPGGTPASYLEIKPWMLNKYSKNPDAAWQTIEFLSSAPVIKKWVTVEGFTAPRNDVLKSPVTTGNWWTKAFAELLPQGVALDPLNWAPVYTAILTQMQAVVFGKSTPAQAATALHAQLTQFSAQGLL